jgi:hypothetical protein
MHATWRLKLARDVVATSPGARRALDAQHIELADQAADRSVACYFSEA